MEIGVSHIAEVGELDRKEAFMTCCFAYSLQILMASESVPNIYREA